MLPRFSIHSDAGLHCHKWVLRGHVFTKCCTRAQDLFSLAVVLYEIFTKTITAATVIVMGTPHECSDYAYKVCWWRLSMYTARDSCRLVLQCPQCAYGVCIWDISMPVHVQAPPVLCSCSRKRKCTIVKPNERQRRTMAPAVCHMAPIDWTRGVHLG